MVAPWAAAEAPWRGASQSLMAITFSLFLCFLAHSGFVWDTSRAASRDALRAVGAHGHAPLLSSCRGDSTPSSPRGDAEPNRGQRQRTARRPRVPYAPDLQRRRALGRRADQKPPGKRPTLRGRTPEAESCNLSGLGSSRGSGTCRALPDATFCRPFRAGTLRNGDVGSL